eukprot:gb/GFBE01005735.1/.p1 GENE.gb/GFBE01005735.1/~~gb/GFBE01005735.1/.p1  ORF type:complete len:157 (+),score=34.61 gb/GFBE01005735.1/:1-471(+)
MSFPFGCCCCAENQEIQISVESNGNDGPGAVSHSKALSAGPGTTAVEVKIVEGAPVLSPRQQKVINFKVKVKKTFELSKLGVDLHYKDKGVVTVQKVFEDGLIAQWNAENPSKSVQAGDMILEVNNTPGRGQDLIHLLTKDEELEIRVKRVLKMSE